MSLFICSRYLYLILSSIFPGIVRREIRIRICIDTTNRKNREVRLVEEIDGSFKVLGVRSGDVDIVDCIQELLNEKGLKPSDTSLYEPKLGPGSFTGLKTGVTVANILNWASGRKETDELDYPIYGAEPNISKPKKG